MLISSDVMNSLIARGFSVGGTLVTMGLAWFKDRNVSTQRVKALDEATRRVGFWDSWLKTQLSAIESDQETANTKNKVQRELATLAAIVEEAFRESTLHAHETRVQTIEFREVRNALAWWRRWLLLYKPVNKLGWIPRIFFYGFLIEAVAIPFLLLDPAQRQDWQYGLLGMVVFLAIFRTLSVWTEKPRTTGVFPSATPANSDRVKSQAA